MRHETVAFILKSNVGRFSESVQHLKSYVMAGIAVLITNVTQPNDQVFHYLPAAACWLARVAFTCATQASAGFINLRPSS